MVEQDGEKYLDTSESLAELNIVTPTTFRLIRKKHNIKSYRMVGQGRAKFYKEQDIKAIERVSPAQD